MFERKTKTIKQRAKMRKAALKALSEDDLLSALMIGFEHFIQQIYDEGKISLPFKEFLEYTGETFDNYILKTCKTEKLEYFGGKMIFEQNPSSKDIEVYANFYFQDSNQKWIMKQRKGCITTQCFSDWDTDESLQELQKNGKLELSIEPPLVEE